MSDIVKICKVHGNLTKDNIKSHKKRNGFILVCSFCRKENYNKNYRKNREKVSKRKLDNYHLNSSHINELRKNSLIRKKYNSNYSRLSCKNLTDSYIKECLKKYTYLKSEDISQELVELKRASMLLNRKLKEIR